MLDVEIIQSVYNVLKSTRLVEDLLKLAFPKLYNKDVLSKMQNEWELIKAPKKINLKDNKTRRSLRKLSFQRKLLKSISGYIRAILIWMLTMKMRKVNSARLITKSKALRMTCLKHEKKVTSVNLKASRFS